MMIKICYKKNKDLQIFQIKISLKIRIGVCLQCLVVYKNKYLPYWSNLQL